jgi:hypothetical protein
MLPLQAYVDPQPPQLGAFCCVSVVSLTHVVPQSVVPPSHPLVHAYVPVVLPGEQAMPEAHVLPHTPQFGELDNATHPLPASAQSA